MAVFVVVVVLMTVFVQVAFVTGSAYLIYFLVVVFFGIVMVVVVEVFVMFAYVLPYRFHETV